VRLFVFVLIVHVIPKIMIKIAIIILNQILYGGGGLIGWGSGAVVGGRASCNIGSGRG
jgi:hypothetical protein